MFKKFKVFLKPPTLQDQVNSLAPQLTFAIPGGYFEHFQVVEVNLDKLLAANQSLRMKALMDLSNLRNDSPRKITNLVSLLNYNHGMMHIPAVSNNGEVSDGYHRLALLHHMGVKTVPVLIHDSSLSEAFKEQFGVDKPYYQSAGEGTYYEFRSGHMQDFPVQVVIPLRREAIMQQPRDYLLAAVAADDEVAYSKRLQNEGSGRANGSRRRFPPTGSRDLPG
jgi:hypothetical protein